jgi:hypothetical protein
MRAKYTLLFPCVGLVFLAVTEGVRGQAPPPPPAPDVTTDIRALSRHFAAKNIQVVNDELQIKKDCIGEVAPLLKALAESPRPVFSTLEGIQKSIWLAEFDRPRRPRIWIN